MSKLILLMEISHCIGFNSELRFSKGYNNISSMILWQRFKKSKNLTVTKNHQYKIRLQGWSFFPISHIIHAIRSFWEKETAYIELFQKKIKHRGRGLGGEWGHWISRSIEERACVELQGLIKKEVEFQGCLCGISMSFGFWPWNFQGVWRNFAKFPEVKAFLKRQIWKFQLAFSEKYIHDWTKLKMRKRQQFRH